jgi:hypothetical protein
MNQSACPISEGAKWKGNALGEKYTEVRLRFKGRREKKRTPTSCDWVFSRKAYQNGLYGLGASGIIVTPLLGLGASKIIVTPLFGLGASKIIVTPLFGLGASGIIVTPLF